MARPTHTNNSLTQHHGKPKGIPPKKPSMEGLWRNMCGKTKDAAEKAVSDAILEATPTSEKIGHTDQVADFDVNLRISLDISSHHNASHVSPDKPPSFQTITTLPVDRPAVQPIGRHCIVIGRISSNKGLTSTKLANGNKIQHDQAGNMKKRREEGLTLGKRLGQNAPTPILWETLESTFHKQQSCVGLEWRKDKKGQATMVTDIKAFFHKIPKGAEVTVLLRCLDGLVVHRSSFNQFVRFIVDDCGLKLLLVFQIYKFNKALYHSRMVSYLGLGSVIAFTGNELRQYTKSGEDPTGETRMLYKCLKRMKNLKKWTNIGLQNRNTLPPADMYGARDLGGELPESGSEDSE
jgi:hypothetical protein